MLLFGAIGAWAAEARSITGVERIVSAGEMFLNVTFEAGEPGDSHALYIAYDTEDKGADISNWAELQRGCNVAADATSATIPVSPLFTGKGYTVCRVFLTTSAAPYDTQIEYLRQSGTQYIDTGIKPDATSVAVMDTKFDSNATRQQRFFAISSDTYKSGNKTINDNSAGFSFDCYINGDGKFATACQNGKGDWKAAGSFTTDRVRISLSAAEKHHVTITNLVTGAQIANKTYNTTCDATSITSVLVFAQHFVQNSAVSIPADRIAQGARLYSFSITTNSVAACDYKPCKFGGRVGVYDAVTDTVIYSASETDFDAVNSGSPVACSLLAGEAQLAAAPSATRLFLTWSGTAENWGDANAWTLDGENATWSDGNNALFATANSAATLAADVNANSIAFSADATVAGTSNLSVKSVSVAEEVNATISAPIASAFEKTGAGTLTLGSSRTDQTTVSEGTLAMSGSGTELDWSKLTLGTDPEKPVTVRFEDGAAPTSGAWYLGSGNITSTVVKASGDWSRGGNDIHIGSGVGADTTFIHEGGSLTCSRFIRVGTSGAANSTLILSGGVITNSNTQTGSGREPRTAIGYLSDGTLIVTNGASLAVTGQYLGISDANRMKGIVEIYDGSTVDVAYAVIFGQVSQQGWGEGKLNLHAGGTLATQVIRCSTNYATPADATAEVNFDGGILKANSSTRLIQKHDRLTVNVSEKGGTIDNNGKNIIIEESFNGPGTINLIGSGTTTFAAGVGAEGGVSVANGTTLALDVTEQSSLGSLTLAAGSKLALSGVTQSSLGAVTLEAGSIIDIATPATDVAAFAATALNLPAEDTVTLTSGGEAFGEGLYAICKMSGVTAEVGEKFAPVTGDLVASWSVVDGDTLMLTVGAVDGNTWTGGANNGNLSDPKNWYGGKVPESGTVTINTTGTLTVGDTFRPDVIVFPETCGAVTIAGENAITGIMAITNLSSSICTFEVPVAFAGEICVSQGAYYYYNNSNNQPTLSDGGKVRFAGGVTGTSFADGTSRMLDGAFTIPASANWTASTIDGGLWTVTGGSSLTLTGSSAAQPLETDLSAFNNNGAFTTAVIRTSSSPVCLRNEGEFVVTEELEMTLPGANRHIAQRASQSGKYKFEKVTLGDNGNAGVFYIANRGTWYSDKHVYIGAGGLCFAEGAQPNTAYAFGRLADDDIYIYPWHSDYTIGAKGGTTRDIIVNEPTYFQTDDADGVARTVTLNGIADVHRALTVKGHGRFQVNSDGMNSVSSVIGGITVTDSATLAYASGADLGAGAVTVGVNATMELASGAHTFGGGLTLNDGATLAFNFTERAVTPQIAIAEGKSLTANGAVKVKISADSKWPTAGEKVLTTCGGFDAEGVTVSLAEGAPKWAKSVYVNEDGNIVLDVKPMATKVIVR